MDPVSVGLVTAGGLALTRIVDYLPDDIRPTNYGLLEREERMEELYQRHRFENERFQLLRDKEQERFQVARDIEHERFQLEIEAQRMSFQEHLELRRLQFQVKMEKRREEFQTAIQARQFEHSREIAQFQARAMRETQILVARENAQNMLENQIVMEALKTFPLNISPLVLLNNRPHTLSSLLRFTLGEQLEIESKNKQKRLIEAKPADVLNDVMDYAKHPEALNIFIAPVFVDSKIANQKLLSTRIWETTYQKIESFFTKYYSRDSERPVMFYPTAWNDKYTSGVHASETLHYFLKDLPCIVLEPKFDGSKLRMAISFWGLGYGSTEHHRIELEFDVNIGLSIANAVYQRSKDALDALDILTKANVFSDFERRKNDELEKLLSKNIKIYEAFRLGELRNMNEEVRNKLLSKVTALGINKLFTVDPVQDLEPLAGYFADQIGVILALYADIHHLMATRALPKLPYLMSFEGCFQGILTNRKACELLHNSYWKVLARIRDEECCFADEEQANRIRLERNNQMENIRRELKFDPLTGDSWKRRVVKWVKQEFGFEHDDFEKVWEKFLNNVSLADISFVNDLKPLVDDEDKLYDLEMKLSEF